MGAAQHTHFRHRTGYGAGGVWYGIVPDARADVDEWMNREHVADLVALEGVWRGRRYRSEDPSDTQSYFGLYEARDPAAFTNEAHARHAEVRSEWTDRMVPHFHDLEGGLYVYSLSSGSAIGGRAATLRFRSANDGAEVVRTALRDTIGDELAHPQIAGIHLLEPQQAPAPPTGDGTSDPDWLVLVEATGLDGIDRAIAELQSALSQTADIAELRVQRWELTYALSRDDD